jgi:hypothetical protein
MSHGDVTIATVNDSYRRIADLLEKKKGVVVDG